jgi:hypothetical protein
MPGLGPGTHVFAELEDVDGRDKPGHDEFNLIGKRSNWLIAAGW